MWNEKKRPLPTSEEPSVCVFGGQDTPSIDKLMSRWHRACGGRLPPHVQVAVQWPRQASHEAGRGPCVGHARVVGELAGLPPKPRPRRAEWALETRLSRMMTAVVEGVDARLRFQDGGAPQNLLASGISRFADFSLRVLYDREGLGSAVMALATSVLRAHTPRLIVAHSFGGTIAWRAAWQLWLAGEREFSFSLITLGTSSGPTVLRSPLFRDLPRTSSGELAAPPNLRSWRHFWSRNDVWVAAPALPRRFQGVSMYEVETAPLFSGRAHALSAYLAAPEVLLAARSALHAANNRRLRELAQITHPSASTPTLLRLRTG